MAVGIITGTGTYALPGFEHPQPEDVDTPFGPVQVTRGTLAGVDVLHISRHAEGHVKLSSGVTHQANISALKALGAECVIGCTACGACDTGVELGSLVVFDDLFFLSNRLPDGSICTLYTDPGDPLRGHWIYEKPFSNGLRSVLLQAAHDAGRAARDGGVYGHVDGPRFNTPAEIAMLQSHGVTAVSQTGGPETTLAGEAELPYALIGFATDYANNVAGETTPVEEIIRLMGESTAIFGSVLVEALPRIAGAEIDFPGVIYRFEQ